MKTHKVYYPLYEDKDHFIILVTGGRSSGKCLKKGTKVMMSNLTTKCVEDVKVGDYVMGDDGQPREVLGTNKGYGELYKVKQKGAEDYVVNADHIITLKKRNSCHKNYSTNAKGLPKCPSGRYPQYPDVTDMNVLEFKNKSTRFRNSFSGFKSESIPYEESNVEIEPYLLGLWLGDGTEIFPNITNADNEIADYLQDYCERNDLELNSEWKQGANRFRIVKDGKKGNNSFLNSLKHYNLIGNKHIPQEYISNSERVRLELLAGILDADGTYGKSDYELTQSRHELIKQVKFIADTLGFRTRLKSKVVNGKTYYRLHISGNIDRIPCKVRHKKPLNVNYKTRDWHKSHLDVVADGEGEWYGFAIDGNHRFLLEDGTVTHNSFGIGTFIERLTFQTGVDEDGEPFAHQVLFSRYTMVSAKISVIPEFNEKIELDGTSKYFHTTSNDIVNKLTGAHIMFRGIQTSSGNQTAKLKSIHGLTTFICDEAEEWQNEKEFETIMLSIRKKGIQNRIIIIMNPTDTTHFIYQRYIKDTHKLVEYDGVPVQISTHPSVLHIHTTYLDNIEHCGEEFLKEVATMKEKNPEKYAHIVMGQWADVAEGAIYKNWSVCKEFPEYASHIYRGLDFGYTCDPSACVKIGVVGNDLYVQEIFYETGMLLSDLKRELKKSDLFVYADSADPRLVDEILFEGTIIYPVRKGAGSIVAGIEKIKDFDHIYVTEDSYNVQQELRNYVWAKDKYGNRVNQPEDKNNHCMDAMRYAVYGGIFGMVLETRNVTSDVVSLH